MTDSRPTLLAIDDEPGMLALVEKFACDMNFRVLCHRDGRHKKFRLPDRRYLVSECASCQAEFAQAEAS